MCARRKLSLALIAVGLAAGLEATGAGAAAPSACRTRCAKAHDTCLDAAGAQRNGLRAACTVTATAPGAIRVVLRRKADAVEGVGSTSAFSATIDAVTANGRDFASSAPCSVAGERERVVAEVS